MVGLSVAEDVMLSCIPALLWSERGPSSAQAPCLVPSWAGLFVVGGSQAVPWW